MVDTGILLVVDRVVALLRLLLVPLLLVGIVGIHRQQHLL